MAVLVSMRLWIMSRNRNVAASLKGKDGFSQLWEAHSHCVRGLWLMRNCWCTALLAQSTACHSFTQLPQKGFLDAGMSEVPSAAFFLPSLLRFIFSFLFPFLTCVSVGIMITQWFHAALRGGGVKQKAIAVSRVLC